MTCVLNWKRIILTVWFFLMWSLSYWPPTPTHLHPTPNRLGTQSRHSPRWFPWAPCWRWSGASRRRRAQGWAPWWRSRTGSETCRTPTGKRPLGPSLHTSQRSPPDPLVCTEPPGKLSADTTLTFLNWIYELTCLWSLVCVRIWFVNGVAEYKWVILRHILNLSNLHHTSQQDKYLYPSYIHPCPSHPCPTHPVSSPVGQQTPEGTPHGVEDGADGGHQRQEVVIVNERLSVGL